MEGKEGYSAVVGLMSDECTGYLYTLRGARVSGQGCKVWYALYVRYQVRVRGAV